MRPKLKVCGMKYPDNLSGLLEASPDFIGFIFYRKSARFMGETLAPTDLASIPNSIKKVGVFVDETIGNVIKAIKDYNLDFAQLHGDESPEYCQELRDHGTKVIKAFRLDETFDFDVLNQYPEVVDYFLFDTKGANYGGNGQVFDWELLQQYKLSTPFFLSGGLDLEHFNSLDQLKDLPLFALDINSRFEDKPGLKNLGKVKEATQSLAIN